MNRIIIVAVAALLMNLTSPSMTHAGWMDKINQVTGKINQTSQQVDQIDRAKQQVQGLGARLPKPTAKNKNSAEPAAVSADGFELTKTSNPIKGEWGTEKKACAVNSATCMNGLVDFSNCMHQTANYYFRLVAANLQNRIDMDEELTDDDRMMLEEDIASLEEAINNDANAVTDPDPEYPQRYLAWLSDEDQQEIQKMNSKYMNEVRQDCDARFGGMARYSK